MERDRRGYANSCRSSLVNAGLFTTSQLQSLQAVKPWLAPPPPGAVGASAFKEVSMTLSWPIRITEGISIEPSIAAFNVFNMSNFAIPTDKINDSAVSLDQAILGGAAAGSVNGTSPGANRASLRVGTGSGVFSNGAPRQMEFGLKLNF